MRRARRRVPGPRDPALARTRPGRRSGSIATCASRRTSRRTRPLSSASFPWTGEGGGVGGYLHLQPGECFVGGGMWHPAPAAAGGVAGEGGRRPDEIHGILDKPALSCRASARSTGDSLKRASIGLCRRRPRPRAAEAQGRHVRPAAIRSRGRLGRPARDDRHDARRGRSAARAARGVARPRGTRGLVARLTVAAETAPRRGGGSDKFAS